MNLFSSDANQVDNHQHEQGRVVDVFNPKSNLVIFASADNKQTESIYQLFKKSGVRNIELRTDYSKSFKFEADKIYFIPEEIKISKDVLNNFDTILLSHKVTAEQTVKFLKLHNFNIENKLSWSFIKPADSN